MEVLFELSLQARFQGIAPNPLLAEFDIYHNIGELCDGIIVHKSEVRRSRPDSNSSPAHTLQICDVSTHIFVVGLNLCHLYL